MIYTYICIFFTLCSIVLHSAKSLKQYRHCRGIKAVDSVTSSGNNPSMRPHALLAMNLYWNALSLNEGLMFLCLPLERIPAASVISILHIMCYVIENGKYETTPRNYHDGV